MNVTLIERLAASSTRRWCEGGNDVPGGDLFVVYAMM
jgi:hypothetical protein